MRFDDINHFILFGGGELLVEFVLRLIKENFKVLVVTSERHLKGDITIDSKTMIFKNFLITYNIDYYVSRDVNTDKYVINKINRNTLGLSINARWIFKSPFINHFKGRLLNIHGTKLPQDRGGATVTWYILNGNHSGATTLHQVDSGVDTGPIVKYKKIFYPLSYRKPIDYQKLNFKYSYNLLCKFLEDIKKRKDFKCIGQKEHLSSYWPRLSTEIHGFIDWNWSLKDVKSFICAFDEPYKGASTFINNERVYLKDCFSDFNDGRFHPFQKGIVYRKINNALFVATEDGSLILRKVKNKNGEDVINKINVGDRFHTPSKFLEDAKRIRVFYTPKGIKNI